MRTAALAALVSLTVLGACSATDRTATDASLGPAASTIASTSSTATTSAPTTVESTRATTTVTTTGTSVVTSTSAPAPPFRSSTAAVTAAQLGASWHEGCPVGPGSLRAVTVSIWGFDGAARQGTLVVHGDHAATVIAVFADIYAARFAIERMTPIVAYGGDDDASMAANNTSAFNCRPVTGGSSWSQHSYGWAIDINPVQNPYVSGSTVLPPAGRAYLDRSAPQQGKIRAGDAVVRAFSRRGWGWGGAWSSPRDYQHFSATGH
jgi:hypothetical protein